MAKKTCITAPAAGAPVGPYSQAITVGDWIFVSAEKGVDPETGSIVEGGVKAETRQALENIRAILVAADSSLEDVVRCVVHMAQGEDFGEMNEAYARFFPTSPPARTTVMAAGLPMGLKVLIEVTAIRGCGSRA